LSTSIVCAGAKIFSKFEHALPGWLVMDFFSGELSQNTLDRQVTIGAGQW